MGWVRDRFVGMMKWSGTRNATVSFVYAAERRKKGG